MKTLDILLVDDDPACAELVGIALQHGDSRHVLHQVESAEDAVSWLRREGSFANAPWPDLLLLDLSLPGTTGLELLATLRADPELAHLVVLVLATSTAEADVRRAYELRANAYMSKPQGLDGYESLMTAVTAFWLRLAQLPPRGLVPRSTLLTTGW